MRSGIRSQLQIHLEEPTRLFLAVYSVVMLRWGIVLHETLFVCCSVHIGIHFRDPFGQPSVMYESVRVFDRFECFF